MAMSKDIHENISLKKSSMVPAGQRGGQGGLKLFWQCPYMETIHFKKGASLTNKKTCTHKKALEIADRNMFCIDFNCIDYDIN